jgi:hypothetical protein
MIYEEMLARPFVRQVFRLERQRVAHLPQAVFERRFQAMFERLYEQGLRAEPHYPDDYAAARMRVAADEPYEYELEMVA